MISGARSRRCPAERIGTESAELDPDRWDHGIASATGGTIFQSYDWGEARSRNGWEPHRITVDAEPAAPAAAVQVGLRRIGPLRVVYGQRGPVWSSLEGLQRLLDEIARFARGAGAAFVKLNPDIPPDDPAVVLFREAGYLSASSQAYMHKATYRIDLDTDEDRLLAGMEGRTRRAIGRSLRDSVEVDIGSTPEILSRFERLTSMTAQRRRFAMPSHRFLEDLRRAFAPQGRLAITVARTGAYDVAAAIHLSFAGRTSYMWGGSAADRDLRKCCASERVQWEAMREAMRRGMREFDLHGVPVDAQGQPISGISLFKRGFGARLFRLVGDLDLPLRRSLYLAWKELEPLYLCRKGVGG